MVKKGDVILETTNKLNSFKVKSSVFRSVCETMELKLREWIVKMRSEGKCLGGDEIKRRGFYLYNEIHPLVPSVDPVCNDERVRFVASDGWFRGFLSRRKLSYRRVTTF